MDKILGELPNIYAAQISFWQFAKNPLDETALLWDLYLFSDGGNQQPKVNASFSQPDLCQLEPSVSFGQQSKLSFSEL